jgi:hypothetical protein
MICSDELSPLKQFTVMPGLTITYHESLSGELHNEAESPARETP